MPKSLVVENSPYDTALYRQWLEAEGVQVDVCLNNATAEEALRGCVAGYDVVFLRWDLLAQPATFELLTLCRQRWPGKPVVVVFDEVTTETALRVHAFGARGMLEKPLTAEQFRPCLQELLDSEATTPYLSDLRARIHGESDSLLAALRQLARVIPNPAARVLIVGENGTGKEQFARALHTLGPNADAPFIRINVAAIPDHLLESELFGHEKGAFTGATQQRKGFFEQAGDGTLLLDEIGELPASLQPKLLRALQERRFFRVGGTEELTTAARLVCTTNRPLVSAMQDGDYRADLYHRLGQVQLHVPPLRERPGDIERLAEHFLVRERGARRLEFAHATQKILRDYHWPGNVRELENAVIGAVIACAGELILPQHLPMRSMGEQLFAQSSVEPIPMSAAQPSLPSPLPINLPPSLLDELARLAPPQWLRLDYRAAVKPFLQAFDRWYLPQLVERHNHNLTAAAKTAGFATQTLRNRWKDAGLPPLSGEEEAEDA